MNTHRPAIRFAPLGLALAAFAVGCTPPATVEIQTTRMSSGGGDRVLVGASSAQRFGHAALDGQSSDSPGEVPLLWDVPQGWGELPPSGMRLANLRPGGHPEAECTLIIMPGSAGGLQANLARWSEQMGQEPLDDAAIAALPTLPLLGTPATLIELEGDYRGMGDSAQEGFALQGLVLPTEQFTIFVKMTGPAELVAAESEAFRAFCRSIRGRSSGDGHSADDGHDHSGHDHGDHSHGETSAGDEPADTELESSGLESSGLPEAGFATASSGGSSFDLPSGWRDAGPRSMRSVNLAVGEGTQCYVIELPGEAGGLVDNLNRWRGEVGLGPIGPSEVETMRHIELFGASVPLLDVQGDYSGMGGTAGADYAVLATLLIRPTASVFVKMVGPQSEVLPQREAFVAFCASLQSGR